MNPVDIQSALHPAGPQAAHIAWLWWLMLSVCAAVFVIVLAAMGVAVYRGRHHTGPPADEAAMRRAVSLATGATVVILIALLFASVWTGRAIAALGSPTPLDVEVTAAQWWWQVEYAAPQPSNRVTTANEIHLPIGRVVRVLLKSTDVIHSFWIPNLHGKVDLIPGRGNVIWLRADTAGTYRGQCAEFCGIQHAHMALMVIVEPEPQFEAWLVKERRAAEAPQTPEQQRGRDLVAHGSCALCHSVQGDGPSAHLGPDLTHFASRPTIAAGELENTPENLAAWLADPQRIKVGSRMPATGLRGDDLQAVVAYLEQLK